MRNHDGSGTGAHAVEAAAAPEASLAVEAPHSTSPGAGQAWCTVTDRLRRLRADLEVRACMHASTPHNPSACNPCNQPTECQGTTHLRDMLVPCCTQVLLMDM